ncbi:MAG: bile acid:sodium symporter [Sphingomonas sp.]|uniref:bile acid:sodium symporter family protein n=1 Tax=Sphingomonas sp. TaxID=28214 RepID=UPI0035A8E899|nr:bile acid:sodium symporter [Sphingomonas sp.]
MTLLRRLIPDRFIMILMATLIIATLLPASGTALTVVGWLSNAAIFLLFFLHGARLSPQAVIDGAKRWRLQAAILAFGYLALPVATLAISHALAGWMSPELLMGLIFLGVLPTTVQSSIAYASIARGNVAAAVIAAAASNLIGVVLTPLLFAAIASTTFGAVSLSGVGRIALLLLLPFALGQLLRTRVLPTVQRHAKIAGMMDKLTIVLAVYVAFSDAATQGLWQRVSAAELGALALVVLALLLLAFAAAWGLGAAMRLDPADRATMLFSGAHKSLATGAPMARILFPPTVAGAVILPLMLYHQLQLMLSAVIAARLADDNERIT